MRNLVLHFISARFRFNVLGNNPNQQLFICDNASGFRLIWVQASWAFLKKAQAFLKYLTWEKAQCLEEIWMCADTEQPSSLWFTSVNPLSVTVSPVVGNTLDMLLALRISLHPPYLACWCFLFLLILPSFKVLGSRHFNTYIPFMTYAVELWNITRRIKQVTAEGRLF